MRATTRRYSPIYATPGQVALLYDAKLFTPARPSVTRIRWFTCRIKGCRSSGPLGSRVAYNAKDSGQMGAHVRNTHPEVWGEFVDIDEAGRKLAPKQ
jgi:hypothetical protein